LGTNQRYADSIDRRARLRTEAPLEQPPSRAQPEQTPVRDWQPPWPPIRIAEAEWVVMRESTSEPVAIIRVVRMGPRNETFYRVVTWAPTSEGRRLVGYYPTLAEADRAVLFSPKSVTP
jgi:hypothetical protein